ncbi:LysR family transcriptional regulator [Nocardiopsis sp. MG754419]|uniref:LysR family transcriptional regulator n=1 Tax=Nocardiopsis sp. MG754419 TaxID=2259865 RepID=UPI001BACC57C|nr:LysR family transcriptional regulator [Nocardiopsis sp. MG754419]MBR8744201.1 LysR family transcriptional regulator [Nocardiopsis sp. MG754419]
MIDLRRLRILRAVAHHGTVTAAAESLHFTPSAASQQIRQLARELDVTLLEPQGRGVRLTAAARSLLEHADTIQALWEQAEIEMRDLGVVPAGPLRVAGFPVALARLLAPMAVSLLSEYPRLDVRILEAEPGPSLDLLFRGDIDLAIVESSPTAPPLSDTRFAQSPLLLDPLDLVVADTHPLADRDAVPLVETAQETWVLPPPGTTCHAHAMTACGAVGFTPQGRHQAQSWASVASLVAGGLGIALVPRLADLSPDLPVRRVPLRGVPAPARQLLVFTRAGARGHPAIAAAVTELEHIALDVVV